MIINIIVLFIAISCLLLINKIQLEKNFCLDQVSSKEKHKYLAQTSNKVPLSGTFFFLPIITYQLFSNDNSLLLICTLFFCVGLLSDLKIIFSPKKRFFLQFFLIVIYLFLEKNLIIDFRINFLSSLMNYEFLRILILSFFLLVLINGFNFVDGVNSLCSLNIFIITLILTLISNEFVFKISFLQLDYFMIFLFVFVLFNFFGKNFLGDGAVYGLSLFIGILLIKLSILSNQISPYFIANLLWYPAFENLFSIIRRAFDKKKNYIADNFHLHQLIFKFLMKKNYKKKKYFISSLSGIMINLYLFVLYYIGYLFYSKTNIQLILISVGIMTYIFVYLTLLKKIK